MHILVIFTGGTIGSTLADGWISPDDATRYTLINAYQAAHGEAISFSTRAPYTILSENLCAENLTALTTAVCQAVKEDFDGIIVTHGTDTLQYAAAALAYATGNDCIPTVLVSSNYPLNDPRTNGNQNFEAAVAFIAQKCGRGVFVAYKNENEVVSFHNALSLLSHTEASDALFSRHNDVYAVQTENGIVIKGKTQPCETLPTVFNDNADILVVTPLPAENYAYPLENYRAIILRPYHSGTFPTDVPAFTAFCKRAKTAGIPIFAVNIPQGTTYASSKEFDPLGITPLYDTTFISAYVKLWMQYSK